jgi:TetR/AcrR family transcriptional regulator
MQKKPATAARLGTRRQPDASREAILRAASLEFSGEGLPGARMDAIARSAGVNKALLYYYFHDKDALYDAVLEQFFRPLFERLNQVLDSPASPGERILVYARTHFDTIAEKPHYARLFQGEMMSAGRGMSPRLSEIAERYARPLYVRLQTTLMQGIQSDQFRPIDIIQVIPSMIATIVFYFVAAPMLRRVGGGIDPFSTEALASRRAAVLDFIAAALFADRESGLRLAGEIAARAGTVEALLPAPTQAYHRVAARRSK